MAVENALENTGDKPSDITDVILVGGSSRMPMVKDNAKIFGKEPQIFGNPDELVALGAALYAAYKSDSEVFKPITKTID